MLPVDDKRRRPRVEFTPAGYKRARRRYEQGRFGELVTMLKEAATDSHVSGCLVARRAGYKRAHTLRPFDDTAADIERRDFVRAALSRLGLRDLLEAIHEARLFCFNVIDFDWEVESGRQVPVAFKEFEQYHFRYEDRRHEDGSVRKVLMIDRGRSAEPLPETTLVVESRKMPIMLPVLRDYILSEFGWESFAAFLETFGEPFIIATHPPGADHKQKKEIDDALATFNRSTRGRKPAGVEFEIVESKRGTGDHSKFIELARKGISISLLGHANAVEQGGGLQIGDHPVGFEVKFEIGTDDCHFAEPHVNRLIRLVYDRNFADRRYPAFSLVKEKPMTHKQRVETLNMVYRMGFTILPDEVRKLGIELPPDQEPVTRDPLNLFD